jgi:uracil-DNA glycosylase
MSSRPYLDALIRLLTDDQAVPVGQFAAPTITTKVQLPRAPRALA